jgi:DNA-directed RNA polymerase sigma subunit (sigma70/sigma32)
VNTRLLNNSPGATIATVRASRERVGQIEAEALAKLRQAPRFLKRLHAYVQ